MSVDTKGLLVLCSTSKFLFFEGGGEKMLKQVEITKSDEDACFTSAESTFTLYLARAKG